MPLTTKHVTERTAEALGFLADQGFRYFRSFLHFRRTDPAGYSYVTINAVTGDRVNYRLAFYLGVRIDALETIIQQILQQPAKLTHDDRSLLSYTVNIGPDSLNWSYPIWGMWNFSTESEFESQLPEVTAFIGDLALPFLNGNTTSDAVRTTLLETPGHAITYRLFQQVLGSAVLAGDLARLEADHALICEQHPKWHAGLKAELADFHARSKAFLEARNSG